MQSPERFITRKELCSLLSIHHDSARRWERQGKLKGYTLTNHVVRYRLSDVERLLDEARHSTRRKPGPKPKAARATSTATSEASA